MNHKIINGFALSACLLLLGGEAAQAQATPTINTDRPDIAESSLTVIGRMYQLEQGVQAEAGSIGFPSLHRLGLGNNLELRVETPLASLTGGGAALAPIALGGKWHFWDGGELGQMPSLGVIGHMHFNNAGGLEPIAKFCADTTLPFDIALGLNGTAQLEAGNAQPTWGGSAAFSRALSSEQLRGYVELSGAASAAAEAGFDGGLTYLLDNDTQFDVNAYKGLTPAATDWYVSIGYSKRWTP